MPIDPTGRDLKRYLAEDPGGPVVMLNLLRFTGDDGRASYRRYTAALADYLPSIGARVLHVGDLGTQVVDRDDFDWDVLLVVEYPSRQAFTAMVADPEYQKVTHLRTEALEEAVLQASTPWS